MKHFYSKLMEKSGFDEALVKHALDFEKEIDLIEFSRLFFGAAACRVEKMGVLCFDEAFYPYEFYQRLKKMPVSVEKAALYIYILLFEEAFRDHGARGLDESIFFETAKRISDAAGTYFADKGEDGIYDYHFLANHVRGSIINLGGFEYQYGSFENKRAIMLHIPDGASLEKQKRLFSYSLARRYFGSYPIIGDSWLLFDGHKKMLPEGSRISELMDDFDIISTHETCDYRELFHVFGHLSDFSYENLPKDTSLQRAYAERIKNGLPVGSAVGKLKY